MAASFLASYIVLSWANSAVARCPDGSVGSEGSKSTIWSLASKRLHPLPLCDIPLSRNYHKLSEKQKMASLWKISLKMIRTDCDLSAALSRYQCVRNLSVLHTKQNLSSWNALNQYVNKCTSVHFQNDVFGLRLQLLSKSRHMERKSILAGHHAWRKQCRASEKFLPLATETCYFFSFFGKTKSFSHACVFHKRKRVSSHMYRVQQTHNFQRVGFLLSETEIYITPSATSLIHLSAYAGVKALCVIKVP